MEPRTVVCQTCEKSFTVTNPHSRQIFCSKKCRPERKSTITQQRNCGMCGKDFVPKYDCQKYCSKDCKWKGFSVNRKVVKSRITCLTCGNEFVPRNETRKFCSRKCARNVYPHVTRPCEICKHNFTTPYRFREVKTCGSECNNVRQSRIFRNREVKQCLVCGKDYEVVQSYKDDAKYCSYMCFLSTRATRQPDVSKICEYCKEEFIVPFPRITQRFCSKSCSNSGENNGMFGKPGTMTGKKAWNNGLTLETDERLRSAGEKISAIIADKLVKGEWKHSFGYKSEHYIGVKNGRREIYLRSSYESAYVRILDLDQSVVSWEYEPMRLPYMFEGSVHNYVPDFLVTYVDGSQSLVEVKPDMLMITKQNAAKQRAAEIWCNQNNIELLLITEKYLYDH